MLRTLREAVETESPSGSSVAVTRMALFFTRQCRELGAKVHTYAHAGVGCAIAAEFHSAMRGAKPILLLGHADTVWDTGTLKTMPFRVRGERAYGPGILDMKSGLIIGLWAIRALRELSVKPRSTIRFLLNPDEETGSFAFRSRILAEARGARACLVLEPAAQGGALKTSRKGVGLFTLTIQGRAAHAGINPEAGVNAISELARQITHIESFARPSRGLTVNVGVVRGGTRSNVISESAAASIDVRVGRPRDGEWIERKMRSLKPVLRGSQVKVDGGMNRPPMERHATRVLYERARGLASQLGFELGEASTGGGSDGCFAAALGIPTLDGLGGVGDGAHARGEHILVRELPRRAALLAALLATI